MNSLPKYVFSNALESAESSNSRIIRGDGVEEVRRLKGQDGRNLLFGATEDCRSRCFRGLIDVIDLSAQPVFLGVGKAFFRQGQTAALQLIAAKTFVKGIVKLTYGPQYA
jgi:dihydrofolate reductase